ncbi:hypothetical protein HN425_03510 [Candidatus Woesearchaeota archaeon]|nr:hypothetical protein [Candidatus Woesearchaeota archaeon]
MSPEELTFQTNFVYPLGLLVIGGIITAGLIPYFNRLHENKLRKLEQERESAQKRIDLEREDHKFELEIKDRMYKKISDIFLTSCKATLKLQNETDEKKKIEVQKCFSEDLIKNSGEIHNYLRLYFNNSQELKTEFTKFAQTCRSTIYISICDRDSNKREKAVEIMNEDQNLSLTEKEIKELVHERLPPAKYMQFKQEDLLSSIQNATINLKKL